MDTQPLIEIGLVVVGRLDPVDTRAVENARQRVKDDLRRWFPEFEWRITVVERYETVVGRREQPAALFQQGQWERDFQNWDFVLVVTSADLIGYDKPFTWAAVSRTLDLAVLSTARVDPRAVDAGVEAEARVEVVSHRLGVLILRCLAHLNGLEEVDETSNLMWEAGDPEELDEASSLTDDQISEMRGNLLEIADLRLEEQDDPGRRNSVAFLLKAAWCQRSEIVAGVLQAAPWEFPIRLSRLTTAAVSAALVLLITAEVWDMSLDQSALSVGVLALVVLTVTTTYVVSRQKLLVRRQDRLLSEQIAVSNITSVVTVLCGLICTLCCLYATCLALALLLFSRQLVHDWSAAEAGAVQTSAYLLTSGVVSALGVSIGALGAAFEDQVYFRHVIFVDKEL